MGSAHLCEDSGYFAHDSLRTLAKEKRNFLCSDVGSAPSTEHGFSARSQPVAYRNAKAGIVCVHSGQQEVC